MNQSEAVDVTRYLLDSYREIREQSEEALLHADEEDRPRLELFLRRVKRQEDKLRSMM